MTPDTRFASNVYSLIAGPARLTQPINSIDVQDIAEYPLMEVLSSLFARPGVRPVAATGWSAAWECGDRFVIFENAEGLNDDGNFGSVELLCDCHLGDVLGLWEALRARFPGVWLYAPDSWLHTPMSMLDGYDCDPSWRTSDVFALARGIQVDEAYDRLPILADALEEAGCDSAAILEHCRGPGPHSHGCWVVGLILDKS